MTRAAAPESPHLRFTRLTPENLASFHGLCVDPHVRAYLLDGAVVDRAWAERALATSDALFAARGAGLWLLTIDGDATPEPIGFAGFFVFDGMGPEPQLLYALAERHTGRGYATEAARACLAWADAHGWARVTAAVDAPNAASLAVLRKVGFAQTHTAPGAFGRLCFFARHAPRGAADTAVRSLLALPAEANDEEVLETLVARDGVRIERIVSTGQQTPEGVWYEQDEHEWVLLLAGAARLALRESGDVELRPGDGLLLPAGRAHRVAWTAPDRATVWLAVFFR